MLSCPRSKGTSPPHDVTSSSLLSKAVRSSQTTSAVFWSESSDSSSSLELWGVLIWSECVIRLFFFRITTDLNSLREIYIDDRKYFGHLAIFAPTESQC